MRNLVRMEDLTSADTWKGVVAETIGVLVLVLVGTGVIAASGAIDVLSGTTGADAFPVNSARLVAIALGFGLTYMALVALTAGISGGHINPAVTFAAVVTGRMSLAKGILYVGGQLGGAIIASLILEALLVDVVEGPLGGNLGAIVWNEVAVANLGAAFAIELILGFVLVFVMLVLIVGPGTKAAHPLAPVGPGLIVVVGTLLAFVLTGAAMNPARALGPAIAADIWTDHWIYWIGPLGGAAVAAAIYDSVFTERLLWWRQR